MPIQAQLDSLTQRIAFNDEPGHTFSCDEIKRMRSSGETKTRTLQKSNLTSPLCELNPEYRPINKWNHGVAFVELDEDGHFTVHNRRISNGSLN